MTPSSSGLALVGVAVCLIMVRRTDRVVIGRVFGRRSRWLYMGAGARAPAEDGEAPSDGRGAA